MRRLGQLPRPKSTVAGSLKAFWRYMRPWQMEWQSVELTGDRASRAPKEVSEIQLSWH